MVTQKCRCIQIADCCILFAYSFFRLVPNWAIACSPVMGTMVTEDRLRLRVYTPFFGVLPEGETWREG